MTWRLLNRSRHGGRHRRAPLRVPSPIAANGQESRSADWRAEAKLDRGHLLDTTHDLEERP
jgi:hypothetical protein